MKKTTLIGVLWTVSLTAGMLQQFTDILYFGAIALFMTLGAGLTTFVYIADNWYNFK